MKNKYLWTVLALVLCLFLLAAMPVGAQTEPGSNTQETPAAQQTVDAPVVLTIAAEDPGAMVTAESNPVGGVTVNVNLPPAETDEPPDKDDESNTEAPISPIYYVIVVVMALLLVGAGVYGGYITRFLATLVPPETAASIYQSGVRFGLQVALNQAAQTPGSLDDEFFIEMARLRGLTVTKRIDGTYEVTTPAPPPNAFAVKVDTGGAAPL